MTARTVTEARTAYAALCAEYGTDPLTEEQAILSVGREYLPACAREVLDDSDAATVEYYEWITEQTSQAQVAHDAEIAAGHEWHETPARERSARYYYAASGSVRGQCPHRHLTPEAAERCAERDRRACRDLPGGQSYSDRIVVAVRRQVRR